MTDDDLRLSDVRSINWPPVWSRQKRVRHLAGQIRQARETEWFAKRAEIDSETARRYLEEMDGMEETLDGWVRDVRRG